MIATDFWVTNSLDVALDMAWEDETEEVFIIGGGQIDEKHAFSFKVFQYDRE